MVVGGYTEIAAGCAGAGLLCFFVQKLVRRLLADSRQYHYFCNLLLAGFWLLLALWLGAPTTRWLVGAAFCTGIVGIGEVLMPRRLWLLPYLLLALLCARFGPSIVFISFTDGEFVYLSPTLSLLVTTSWFFLLPLVVRRMDSVPGLVHNVLIVTFALMLMAILLTGYNPQAFFIVLAGLSLLGASWERLGDVFRQLGRPLSAFWSFLMAGASILGVSKGIVFSSTFFVSLGFFAIPLVEATVHWASLFMAERPHGADSLYQGMLRRGMGHSEAIRFITAVCAFLSVVTALLQSLSSEVAWVWWGTMALLGGGLLLSLILARRARMPALHEKPRLWGVTIDNVSMNYALARARGMILSPKERAQLVATVNALGMEEAVRNRTYHGALARASMVLSDGVGLLWGLRFLGMPIQERVAGIDFAEHLCRIAAAEGWSVYFLGARGDTAQACADEMTRRYPGLQIAGARDGYFDFDDPTVAEAVAASGAKILLVAMGIPRQEEWIVRNEKLLGGVLAVGVGGAFDVLSGRLKRSPEFLQKIGLEWLYRLLQEPGRWKKNLGLITFVLRVLATRASFYVWKGEER